MSPRTQAENIFMNISQRKMTKRDLKFEGTVLCFFLAGKCSKKSFSTDLLFRYWSTNFLCSSVGKESACNAGDPGSNPGSGRSPGEGNGNPLQYSCLENPMDRGAWWAAVHGVSKSRTWLKWLSTAQILLKIIPFLSPVPLLYEALP